MLNLLKDLMTKIVRFERVGAGDWYIHDDGTRISTADGDRILRFATTVAMQRESLNLSEAIGYIKAYAILQLSKSFYVIAKKLNTPKGFK